MYTCHQLNGLRVSNDSFIGVGQPVFRETAPHGQLHPRKEVLPIGRRASWTSRPNLIVDIRPALDESWQRGLGALVTCCSQPRWAAAR